MNEIRNIGSPHSRILPASRKERVSSRSSEPAEAVGTRPEPTMERRRNPDRRRGRGGRARVERRTSSDRRNPRIDIEV